MTDKVERPITPGSYGDIIIIIIINNSTCLRHISGNKTIQRRITLYMNIQITSKIIIIIIIPKKIIIINIKKDSRGHIQDIPSVETLRDTR